MIDSLNPIFLNRLFEGRVGLYDTILVFTNTNTMVQSGSIGYILSLHFFLLYGLSSRLGSLFGMYHFYIPYSEDIFKLGDLKDGFKTIHPKLGYAIFPLILADLITSYAFYQRSLGLLALESMTPESFKNSAMEGLEFKGVMIYLAGLFSFLILSCLVGLFVHKDYGFDRSKGLFSKWDPNSNLLIAGLKIRNLNIKNITKKQRLPALGIESKLTLRSVIVHYDNLIKGKVLGQGCLMKGNEIYRVFPRANSNNLDILLDLSKIKGPLFREIKGTGSVMEFVDVDNLALYRKDFTGNGDKMLFVSKHLAWIFIQFCIRNDVEDQRMEMARFVNDTWMKICHDLKEDHIGYFRRCISKERNYRKLYKMPMINDFLFYRRGDKCFKGLRKKQYDASKTDLNILNDMIEESGTSWYIAFYNHPLNLCQGMKDSWEHMVPTLRRDGIKASEDLSVTMLFKVPNDENEFEWEKVTLLGRDESPDVKDPLDRNFHYPILINDQNHVYQDSN